jgi:hypothetical protein
MHTGYWGESQKEKYHWKDQDVGGWILLKWILEGRVRRYGLDRSGSSYGPVEGSCEHCNEFSGSIKCWEVVE